MVTIGSLPVSSLPPFLAAPPQPVPGAAGCPYESEWMLTLSAAQTAQSLTLALLASLLSFHTLLVCRCELCLPCCRPGSGGGGQCPFNPRPAQPPGTRGVSKRTQTPAPPGSADGCPWCRHPHPPEGGLADITRYCLLMAHPLWAGTGSGPLLLRVIRHDPRPTATAPSTPDPVGPPTPLHPAVLAALAPQPQATPTSAPPLGVSCNPRRPPQLPVRLRPQPWPCPPALAALGAQLGRELTPRADRPLPPPPCPPPGSSSQPPPGSLSPTPSLTPSLPPSPPPVVPSADPAAPREELGFLSPHSLFRLGPAGSPLSPAPTRPGPPSPASPRPSPTPSRSAAPILSSPAPAPTTPPAGPSASSSASTTTLRSRLGQAAVRHFYRDPVLAQRRLHTPAMLRYVDSHMAKLPGALQAALKTHLARSCEWTPAQAAQAAEGPPPPGAPAKLRWLTARALKAFAVAEHHRSLLAATQEDDRPGAAAAAAAAAAPPVPPSAVAAAREDSSAAGAVVGDAPPAVAEGRAGPLADVNVNLVEASMPPPDEAPPGPPPTCATASTTRATEADPLNPSAGATPDPAKRAADRSPPTPLP
ncbi:hypothetical protein PAPYR_3774 [Paratrimastix pyriformis]|uniref:Uncharacterized protein n=1 Tax=Paratrimastix pyriformis TaxID=342808 RepID=A0ABQ8UNM5_9EUKA|nr:hypothetical protein PAPYR_3774 [Paratrimastix pyriformis]